MRALGTTATEAAACYYMDGYLVRQSIVIRAIAVEASKYVNHIICVTFGQNNGILNNHE